ncbi:MAG: LysM peptidoglycan-binding domain-containing protein [Actinomycetota bacterium]
MTISANGRNRVVVLLTSVALALVLLLASAVAAQADDPIGPSSASATYVSHTVRSGDTLWDIAASYTPAGDDVRDVIVDIKAANELDSSVIVPGQVLVIPVAMPAP